LERPLEGAWTPSDDAAAGVERLTAHSFDEAGAGLGIALPRKEDHGSSPRIGLLYQCSSNASLFLGGENMRRLLRRIALAAIALAHAAAGANHRGCTAHPNQPRCTYTAVGGEIARGGASSTLMSGWEAWVTREVNGKPTKVVLASGASLLEVTPQGVPVPANPGELVTLDIFQGANGAYPGVVNIGLDTQHP
jgi:hypothetical protein